MPNNFINGFNYLLRGIRLLNSPGLRRFVIAPVLVNILLFAIGIGMAVNLFESVLAWLTGFLPHWLDWLQWILWPLFALSIALLGFYTFALLATFIGLPFYGLLAERTLLALGDKPSESLTLMHSVRYALKNEPKKLWYVLSRSLLCLPLFLIPGINFFAPAIWFLVVAWSLALEYLAFPAENEGISFAQTRVFGSQNRWLILGFGVSINIGILIPIANFVVLPAAVVGATLLWREQRQANATHSWPPGSVSID